MARRIRLHMQGVKSLTLDIIDDDEAAVEVAGVDADTTLASGEPVGFGFTPFSTDYPFPDEE